MMERRVTYTSTPKSTTKKVKKPKVTVEAINQRAIKAIVEQLVEQEVDCIKIQMKSLINRNMDSLRNDLSVLESSMSLRLSNLEKKSTELATKVEESSAKSADAISSQLALFNDSFKASLEAEKSKRGSLVKKLYEKLTEVHQEAANNVATWKAESAAMIHAIQDEQRTQAKDFANLKEKLDLM